MTDNNLEQSFGNISIEENEGENLAQKLQKRQNISMEKLKKTQNLIKNTKNSIKEFFNNKVKKNNNNENKDNFKMIKTNVILFDDIKNKQQTIKNVQLKLEIDRQIQFSNILDSLAEKDSYLSFLSDSEISFFVFDPFRQMYIYLPHNTENPATVSYEILQEQEDLKIKYRQLKCITNTKFSHAAGAASNGCAAGDEAPPSPSALLKHHEDLITEQFYRELQDKKTMPREKERSIKFAMENVKKWRQLFKIGTFYQGVHIKLNLNQAAAILGLRRKTLDEYYKQLNDAEAKGFDFEANMNNKIGVLRKYNKMNQVLDVQQRRATNNIDYFVKKEESVTNSKKNSFQEENEAQDYIQNACIEMKVDMQVQQNSHDDTGSTEMHTNEHLNEDGEEEKFNRNPFQNITDEAEYQQLQQQEIFQRQQELFLQQQQEQQKLFKQQSEQQIYQSTEQFQYQNLQNQVQYDEDIALQHQLEQLQSGGLQPCILNDQNRCVSSLNNSFDFECFCSQNKQQNFQGSLNQNNQDNNNNVIINNNTNIYINNNNNYYNNYQEQQDYQLPQNNNNQNQNQQSYIPEEDISQYIQNTSFEMYQDQQLYQQQQNQQISFQLETSMNNNSNMNDYGFQNNQQEQNYLQNLSFHLNNSNQNISYDENDQQYYQ